MSTYAPCPRCQNRQASPVTFSWWGGVLGPKLLTHVKCEACSAKYNGKTGRWNTAGITLYLIAGFVFAFVVGAALYSLK
jgi:hypothetical protein